ncbi:zeta toxin family protein [Methanohalobium sp.]|uniref:zeta toxin family protein n=1 Tax=Methanohalobium sp. TaxID=2837493 RepID=UPI0025F48403|nr:zeta toxin family protein [Methanohalobium sp.]
MYLTESEKQLLEFYESEKYLEEKLIQFNKGKKFGQIVFLAGGAGSGKGFAIKNFLGAENFKVRDVDEWKKSFMKIAKLKNKYPEIRDLDLKKPQDVFKMHQFIKDLGIKDKTLDNMLNQAKQDRLPNIMFDVTLKDLGDIKDVLPRLRDAGYDPKNIHVVWVLTNFYAAIKNNAGRDRVVPKDILLKTHQGARDSMADIIKGNVPRGVDGSVHVILNNREETVFWVDPKTGEELKKKPVKSFTSLQLKEPGKPVKKDEEIQKQVFDWIENNTPGDSLETVKKVA